MRRLLAGIEVLVELAVAGRKHGAVLPVDYGMPQADIARLIGPHGIDPKTLREHFRKELDRGAPKANARTDASRPLVSGEGPGLPGDIDSSRGFPDWAVVGLLSRSTSPKREVSLEYP